MSFDQNYFPVSIPQVAHSQTEVRKAIEVLLALAESTRMEFWSDEMQASYHRAVDELAALETYFYFYKMSLVSLPLDVHTSNDGDGNGDSVSSSA